MKKIIYTLVLIILSTGVYAQKADGSTKSLVNAEKDFAAKLAKDGANAAYAIFAATEGLVFRPNPSNAKTFYSTPESNQKNIAWSPSFAQVSRSGDWGYTTGAYTINTTEKEYGQYLSVWRVKNGNWQVILDLSINHNKPLKKVTANFIEPKEHYTPKFINEKEQKTGREIIFNTEKTLNTTLKSYGSSAITGFLSNDARLLFPGNEPIIGKEGIIAFNNRMIDKILLKTTAVDKALGGDLAYSYGVATIDYKADLRESFNYVFIWERQVDYNWYIKTQIFTTAER